MPTLRIRSFLTIRHADIDVGRLTVLIGPQAHGKSIVAKLLHVFRRVLCELIPDAVAEAPRKVSVKARALEIFLATFPRYAWAKGPFHIEYEENGLLVAVSRNGRRVQFEFSEALQSAMAMLAKKFQDAASAVDPDTRRRVYVSTLKRRRVLSEIFKDQSDGLPQYEPIFVPAGRSFFSNLERNVFAFISSELEVDPLLSEFGRRYQIVRDSLRFGTGVRRTRGRPVRLRDERLQRVLRGTYVLEGDKEFIEKDGRRVKLINSSSGQQEALPMLLMLTHASGVVRPPHVAVGLSIEEPEAHLFPDAQRDVALLLAETLNAHELNQIVVTTHSPYLLTALNNQLLAGRLYQGSLGLFGEQALGLVIPRPNAIKPKDIRAYRVENGELASIIDTDKHLINAYLIDHVSEELNEQYDRLLSLMSSLNPA